MAMTYTMEPTTHELSPVDAAVLMKKYVTLLGMINYGTPEQKHVAKTHIKVLDKIIHKHLNSAAFETAQRNLGFSEEDIDAVTQTIH
ncbi:hypothetical protein EHV15_35475 [Paenibacillus oralis]|uniref:Uncharacterized protein n=1 Tax=Paenibacillus oralis TaxID=2490856 RepID=A0A3P3TA38_9BACL|nr:hypothetical protein [Paenibacillus oralis]RRJ54877.1 hypothetical protein EHV15_35475 [Paenibacillus oralis]